MKHIKCPNANTDSCALCEHHMVCQSEDNLRDAIYIAAERDALKIRMFLDSVVDDHATYLSTSTDD